MHHAIQQSRHATRTVRIGVTTSAVGVALAGLLAGHANAATNYETVEVAPGDTLAEIAADHGLDPVEGWQRIAEASPSIEDPNVIMPGQQVRVPPPAGDDRPQAQVHRQEAEPPGGEQPARQGDSASSGAAQVPETVVVQPGDTLAGIAAAHGVDDWRRLFYANPQVEDPDVIAVGEELRIPAPGEELDPRPLPQEPTASSTGAPTQAPDEQVTTSQAPAPQPSQASTSADNRVWERLAECESNGNWHANTGNGYYGGLQFSRSSWHAVGGEGLPHQASKAEQIRRAERLQARQGWSAWPACSRELGLR